MRYYWYKAGISLLIGLGVTLMSLGLNVPLASAEEINTENAISSGPDTIQPAITDKVMPSSGKSYFVEFRARSAATYGHMYVLYGQVNGRGEIVKSDIAGLHPAGDSNNCENCSVVPWTVGHILFVPSEFGASDGDLEEKYVADRYRVMVDRPTYIRVAAYIAKVRAEKAQWHALWNNCVAFGRGVAEFMGLRTPAFVWLEPKDFVESLREMNGGTKQGPLKDAPNAAKASVSSPSVSVTSGPSSLPQKPKKQPVAKTSAAAGVVSGASP